MTKEIAIHNLFALKLRSRVLSDRDALDMAIKVLEQEPKMLDTIDFAIDASNGDTNYFVGFRNGLRYTKSLIDGEEPKYESCAEQEPKTGHWISYTDHQSCSCCGKWIAYYENDFNYCPYCGAKMEGEEE